MKILNIFPADRILRAQELGHRTSPLKVGFAVCAEDISLHAR